jgi:hypothetical protein
MTPRELHPAVEQVKHFARHWNELYAARKFEEMKELATEDVGIANSQESTSPTGLIFGRQAYFNGIHGAYSGASGKEQNLLVMHFEEWEYYPLGPDEFYTIGRYTLTQPGAAPLVGVNCWFLRRDPGAEPARWRVFRVINT